MTYTSFLDLVYRSLDGIDLYADIHRPDIDGPVPTVVYVHGGGWATGDRKDFLNTRLVPMAKAGLAVVSVQYRFTDVAPFPAQLLDARAAVAWVKQVGTDYGLAVDKIGSWGSSAGGTIAALLGMESPVADDGKLLDAPVAPVTQAVVAWAAPLDLAAAFARSWLEAEEMPNAGSDQAKFLRSPKFDPRNPLHRAADPLSQATASASPFFLACGDRDQMVPQGPTWRVHDRLTGEGVESSVLVVGGAGHEGAEFDRSVVINASAAHFMTHLVADAS